MRLRHPLSPFLKQIKLKYDVIPTPFFYHKKAGELTSLTYQLQQLTEVSVFNRAINLPFNK